LPALCLYRFAQEALTNIARHARATGIEMTLRKDQDVIVLAVSDDGLGFVAPDFNEDTHTPAAGLVGMKERLEMVDGHLTIESAPGKGSRLTAVVPFVEEGT
jgi:signal transduction histidine kinase